MHQHDRIQHHFNSHPHKEDDGLCASVWFCMLISTHILTKRMTIYIRSSYFTFCISTHILTKRMTKCSQNNFRQPTISTHILTKRMTQQLLKRVLLLNYFNSHPHEEDDCGKFMGSGKHGYFNSHPHEEDDL